MSSEPVVYHGTPRRLRTGSSLIQKFAEAASLVRETESGMKIAGLVCPGLRWIYWSYLKDQVGCERCGTKMATPSAVDPMELATRYLLPFSTDHKGCTKESP